MKKLILVLCWIAIIIVTISLFACQKNYEKVSRSISDVYVVNSSIAEEADTESARNEFVDEEASSFVVETQVTPHVQYAESFVTDRIPERTEDETTGDLQTVSERAEDETTGVFSEDDNGNDYVDSISTILAVGGGETGELRVIREKVIEFGSYPQSRVTNSSTISSLNSSAGTLPTASNPRSWTSYGYYANGTVSDYMWYIDLTLSGVKYRGVYFTAYRPFYTGASSENSKTYQDDNNYERNVTYWFKYEPLSWHILDETGGQKLLICEKAIDCQEYYASFLYTSFSHNGGSGFANNYSLSTIRKWLNETFYNIAFTSSEKSRIVAVTVDNGERSANPDGNATLYDDGVNVYACSNTSDKVFLLAEREISTESYGFYAYDVKDPSEEKLEHDDKLARAREGTEYAKCQGLWVNNKNLGNWWLRSPYSNAPNCAHGVAVDGLIDLGDYVCSVNYGVVPAIKISAS